MNRNNYIVYVDRDGKMPQLRYHSTPAPWASHPYYTVYVGDRPTTCVPYPGQDSVYCYKQQEFLDLTTREVVRGRICHA